MSKKKTTNQSRRRNATKLPRAVKRLFPQVTEALDSTTIAGVKVENRDVDDGKRKNPKECAMARAIKREYKANGAIIGLSYSYLIKGKHAIRFKTPESVRREIVSFDRHHDFAIGEYILTPPSPGARLGHRQHRSKSTNENKKVKRVVHKTRGIRVLERGASY